jgi:hypothetical protein
MQTISLQEAVAQILDGQGLFEADDSWANSCAWPVVVVLLGFSLHVAVRRS